MPQASGFLFIRAAADAFIYLPQECGPSVYMPCVLLIYSVLCLCQTGGGSEWDTEWAAGSLAIPLFYCPASGAYNWQSSLWTDSRSANSNPGGLKQHRVQRIPGNLRYAHTCRDLTPAEPLLCTCTQKAKARKMAIVKRGSSEALAVHPVWWLYLPAVMFSI